MNRMKITRKKLLAQLDAKEQQLSKNLVEYSRTTAQNAEHRESLEMWKQFEGGQLNLLRSVANVLNGITGELA